MTATGRHRALWPRVEEDKKLRDQRIAQQTRKEGLERLAAEEKKHGVRSDQRGK